MMKQKWLALLLALVMVLSLLSASVVAADEKETKTADETKTEETDAAKSEDTAAVQVPEGTLTFESLEGRVKEKNYSALALGESIKSIDELDYKKLEDMMRDGLNEIADLQWNMTQLVSNTNQTINGLIDSYGDLASGVAALGSAVMNSPAPESPMDLSLAKYALNMYVSTSAKQTEMALEQQYDAIRKQLDDLKSGKLKQTNDGAKLQLETMQNQIVMGAESLYITLLGLERSDAALTRSLEALDRTLEEMELRHQMGQISELQLLQVKSGRTQLVSGQQTLQMNMELMRMQLNAMIGEEVDAKLTLQPLTTVTQEQLDAMNLTTEYAQAEKTSYEVYAAKQARDDAEEAYKDAKKEYGTNSDNPEFTKAKTAWKAAPYTYDAAVQSFSLKFRTLYAQVKDYAQVLDAARTALALEQREYEAAQLKYQQGALSHNALLDAENEMLAARDTVADAQSDLFGAYHNYHWAVAYGILN